MTKRFVEHMDRELYTLLDPQYGYLDENGEPAMIGEGLGQGVTHGHDVENAVFFDADDAFDVLNKLSVNKDRVVITQYEPKVINKDIPFKVNTYREYEASPIPKRTQSDVQNQSRTNTGQYALLNPSVGYLNDESQYKSFNLSDAALFTDSDMGKLNLDDKYFIKQPLTKQQQKDLSHSIGEIPNVQTDKLLKDRKVKHVGRYVPKGEVPSLRDIMNEFMRNENDTPKTPEPETPEFDFADFGKGLDDLETDEPTQNQ